MTFSLTKLLREKPAVPVAQCELCALPLEEAHAHVVDTLDRRLLCTCYACGLLFAAPGESVARFKAASRRYAVLPEPLFSDSQWDALGIPIGLAFFFENAATQRIIAFYPGPAGATESQLPLEAWEQLRAREPLIASLLPDVEAALVYRPREAAPRSYIVPIDACYELVGIVRTHWRGISGGEAVQREIEAFFERVAERCE